MNKRLIILFLSAVFVLASSLVYAQAKPPVLFFSDITSGPKAGNSDGAGGLSNLEHGAIVTVWGKNLGSSQGTSKVYFRDSLSNVYESAHVYYWTNADGQSGGGPANLYESHRMQEIAFSVPAAVSDGLGEIYVVVEGVQSNSLEFTVRSGNIYFVKTTGSNSTGDGSWSNPWRTLNKVGNNILSAGDIVYACDGIIEIGVRAVIVNGPNGTESHPISVIAYPSATVTLDADVDGGIAAIHNWNYKTSYWNFAKLNLKTRSTGAYPFKGARFVGNRFTGPTADGEGGTISAGASLNNGGIKALGNYIHDFGYEGTSGKHHVFYISNRTGVPIESFELGWNYLKDNKAYHGLHVYDEGDCGDFYGTMRIHDNVVVNQRGAGVDIVTSGSGTCFSMPVEVYNNLLVNCGLPPGPSWGIAVYIGGAPNKTNIKFYNNIIYGYSDDSMGVQAALAMKGDFGGTWEWKNNIVVDTKDKPYLASGSNGSSIPAAASNNIWYNGGDGNPANPPSWDINPITSNPLFIDPANNDLHLQSGSPAIDAGADVLSVVARDLDGNLRPQGLGFDIGAYEYVSGQTPPLPGDVNKDKVVDIKDLILVAKDFGKTTGFDSRCDVNKDGKVDIKDLIIVAKNFGRR